MNESSCRMSRELIHRVRCQIRTSAVQQLGDTRIGRWYCVLHFCRLTGAVRAVMFIRPAFTRSPESVCTAGFQSQGTPQWPRTRCPSAYQTRQSEGNVRDFCHVSGSRSSTCRTVYSTGIDDESAQQPSGHARRLRVDAAKQQDRGCKFHT